MEPDSFEDYGIVRLGFGLALVVLCLEIAFHCARNRSLTRVENSVHGAFLIVNDVDSIVDSLDRLSLNQRSFLRTGDLHFSQDVAESVVGIDRHLDSLRIIAHNGSPLRDSIGAMDRAIGLALHSLRRLNEIEKSKGPAEAIVLLDRDESIDEARSEAGHLRKLATERAFDRVRTERQVRSMLDQLF
jgi:CHASE3 domain sensor protein